MSKNGVNSDRDEKAFQAYVDKMDAEFAKRQGQTQKYKYDLRARAHHPVVPKPEVLDNLWQEGGRIVLHLDSRVEGTDLPAHLMGSELVELDIGQDLRPHVPGLDVGDTGIGVRLVFNGRTRPYDCFIPWDAIFAIYNGKGGGGFYKKSLPAELMPDSDPEKASRLSQH